MAERLEALAGKPNLEKLSRPLIDRGMPKGRSASVDALPESHGRSGGGGARLDPKSSRKVRPNGL
jgi:hypothetical protein